MSDLKCAIELQYTNTQPLPPFGTVHGADAMFASGQDI